MSMTSSSMTRLPRSRTTTNRTWTIVCSRMTTSSNRWCSKSSKWPPSSNRIRKCLARSTMSNVWKTSKCTYTGRVNLTVWHFLIAIKEATANHFLHLFPCCVAISQGWKRCKIAPKSSQDAPDGAREGPEENSRDCQEDRWAHQFAQA